MRIVGFGGGCAEVGVLNRTKWTPEDGFLEGLRWEEGRFLGFSGFGG